MLTKEIHQKYAAILQEELSPAFGCTEPIALAYCAAKAREVLGSLPESVQIEASGNIIKNVKSVIVPNTGGMKGIPAAAAAGIAAGNPEAKLEVIAGVTRQQQEEIAAYLERVPITVNAMEDGDKLDIRVTVKAGEDQAVVRISRSHTNLVYIARNDQVLLDVQSALSAEKEGTAPKTDRSCLSIEGIVEYAQTAELEPVQALLERQISYNSSIAEEGI